MNSVHKIYSRTQRCFVGSINLHRQFQTQSIRVVRALKNDYFGTYCLRNNIGYKRLYCQTISEEADAKQYRIVNEIKEKYQKQLDEFVSIPENKKYFQILELEIDVMRHNAEKVPSVIKPREWMTIVKMSSKTQRK